MKHKLLTTVFLSTSLFWSLACAEDELFDDSLEDLMSIESEVKVDVGSRSGAKDFLNTPSPVDVITATQIQHSGLTSLTDILRYFIADFNAPETSIADGSDHVRAFTLRGMSPDQVLVLLNGKRVHTSALLHVNGTIGRGSSNVDLDTINPLAIQRIEVLRDGAAAQYGSDAIAGVINIILKGAHAQNVVTAHTGVRKEGDGEVVDVNSFFSYPLKYDGFINTSFEAKKQNATNRAGLDHRVSPPEITSRVGLPESQNFLATLNAELPTKGSITYYTRATMNYRDSQSSTFFRPADDNETVPSLYPDGFLPLLNAEIIDTSVLFGVEGVFDNGMEWELSNIYGYNTIRYTLEDSMNYSLGASSPTSFDNGSLTFIQNTTNLDFKNSYKAFNFAFGLEHRYEVYKIGAGEEASYIDGGSQGFPGYAPESEVDASRNNYAMYVDVTYNATQHFLMEFASRYEYYSDFGSTLDYKLLAKLNINEKLMFRTSASTGFRAPSLAQSHYSNIATLGGVRSGLFQPDSEVAQALGAKPLSAESSKHFTIGGVYQPTPNTSLSIDYFFIQVDDKIMLSNPQELSTELQQEYGVKTVSFFTNAIDTQTQGIDIKLEHKYPLDKYDFLHTSFWYNYSKNSVTAYNTDIINEQNSFEMINMLENGQPKHNLRILTTLHKGDLDYTLNLNAHSSYAQVVDDTRYWFDPFWSADLDIAYKVRKNITLAIGGHNIFDSMPNKWDGLSSTYYGYDSIKPYSRYTPFGYSGAYYYIRAAMRF